MSNTKNISYETIRGRSLGQLWIIVLIGLVFVVLSIYGLRTTAQALTQNTNKSIFDYGQLSAGSAWFQAAGTEFEGRVSGSFNFNYSSPQQSIYQIGYDSSRVEVVSVSCLTSWGCYKSQATTLLSGHHPSVHVCVDVPNGDFPGQNPLFKIRFRAKAALGGASNWWTSSSAVAPEGCQNNIAGTGYSINTADGSGVCGGVFEGCDNGTNFGSGEYIGFGPQGIGTGTSGDSPSPSTGAGGGGGGGSSAVKQSNIPTPLPTASPQGEQEQPKIEPSPFFDGKEYAKGSAVGKYIASVLPESASSIPVWTYVVAGGVVITILGGVGYVWWRKTAPKISGGSRKISKNARGR